MKANEMCPIIVLNESEVLTISIHKSHLIYSTLKDFTYEYIDNQNL